MSNQPTQSLFFTAGPDDESHGLYGRIEAVASGHDNLAPERDDEDD